MSGAAFQCPSDCGRCCTDLKRIAGDDEQAADAEFRDALREMGVYACADADDGGLSLSSEEAAALRAEAQARGMRIDLHPRTYMLDDKTQEAIVIDWHLAHASCPFYEHLRGCTAYEVRPLVCRAFPVLSPAPRWRLAPSCPLTEPTQEAKASGEIRFGSFLRGENQARRRLDDALATLDETAQRILDDPTRSFACGLDTQESARRLAAYRVTAP